MSGRRYFLALALTFLAAPGRSQGLSISASVNRTSVSLDEQLVLSIVISGDRATLPQPSLPSMANFNVHSAGTSQNYALLNGRIQASAQYDFVLVPRFVGKAVIPAITAQAGAQTASTQPIEISVVRPADAQHLSPPARAGTPRSSAGAPAGAGGPDLFVTAEVDNPKPFVNEQILMTVRFYTAVPLLGNAEWVQPQTHGFLDEDIPPAPHKQVEHGGRIYFVTEIKGALFPIQAGALTIGPGTIRCQVQERMDVDPFAPDFFQRFFSQGLMAARDRELKTAEIKVRAQPLPEEGKPDDFSGAVGKFSLSAAIDRSNAVEGDALNLSVTIKGAGNLKTLGELKLPELKAFRVYETVGSLSLDKDSSGVRGSKTFKTVIVPRASGDLDIPPITFNYFDPAARKYVRLSSPGLRVAVQPGKPAAAPVGFSAGTKGPEITRLSSDIRYIKSSPSEPPFATASAVLSGTLWLHVAPSIVFLVSMGFTLYRDRNLQDPAGARSRRALSRARIRIKEGGREKNPEKAAGLLAEALSGYLADKLDRPASLTLREARELLLRRFPSLPAGHLDQMKTVWEELELYRFAPMGVSGSDTKHLAAGVRDLVDALDEEIRK